MCTLYPSFFFGRQYDVYLTIYNIRVRVESTCYVQSVEANIVKSYKRVELRIEYGYSISVSYDA